MPDYVKLIIIFLVIIVGIFIALYLGLKKRLDKKTGDVILAFNFGKIIAIPFIILLIYLETPFVEVINDKLIYTLPIWALAVGIFIMSWGWKFRYNGKQLMNDSWWAKKKWKNIKDIKEIKLPIQYSLNSVKIIFNDGTKIELSKYLSGLEYVLRDITKKIPKAKWEKIENTLKQYKILNVPTEKEKNKLEIIVNWAIFILSFFVGFQLLVKSHFILSSLGDILLIILSISLLYLLFYLSDMTHKKNINTRIFLFLFAPLLLVSFGIWRIYLFQRNSTLYIPLFIVLILSVVVVTVKVRGKNFKINEK